jgi:hypothetical protein
MRKKTLRILGLFALGLIIIFFILEYVGVAETVEVLKNIKVPFFILGIATQIFLFGLWGYRWKIILEAVQEKVSTKNLFIALFIGVMINNITPSAKTGGEPVRAYTLSKREKITVERSFATITADRVFDSFPYTFFSLFSVLYLFFFKDVPIWVQYVLIFALFFSIFILVVTVYLCINAKMAKKVILGLISFFGRFFPKIKEYSHLAEEKISNFNSTVLKIGKHRSAMIKSMLLSFFMLFCSVVRVYFIFLAVGYDVNFIVPMVVTIIAIQVNIIPLLPGGLGTTEGVMIIIFSIFSVPSAISASIAILDRLLSYWLGIFIGAACFFYPSEPIKKEVLDNQQ